MTAASRKIKVLFAIGNLDVGGAQKLLVYQKKTLDTARFEPSLITLFPEKKDTFADIVAIDRCFGFHSTFDIVSFFKLLSYLRRERFDAVVTHLFSANLLVRIAAIIAGVPVILSYEHNIYPDKKAWQIFMDRFLSRWTDRIIVDSEAARIFTAKQENIPLEKFLLLFIPPLLERHDAKDPLSVRKELQLDQGALVVGTVSRLIPDKGHRYLIEAAKDVLARHPKTYFLIVGWGHAEEELRAQVQTLGISDRVKLTGRMDIQDVLPLFDVYVEPAVSTDLPVALMEAMREGKPIVATRIGDIPVFVEDGTTGLTVEPADARGLARAIEKLITDPGLRASLGGASKKKVAEYSLENYMRTFENIVVECLEKKRVA